jgi:hypothetical protein
MADPALTPTAPPAPAAMPDPLAGLRDWHLPDPVSWWPPAPGWWLVAALALVALLLAGRWWRRHRRRGAAVRAALGELRALRVQLAAGLDPQGFAAAISVLLRRLALTRFPREQVAGLSGASWLAFLAATGGGEGFSQGPGRVLAQSPYRNPAAATPDAVADPAALADLAERWIRANRGIAA